MIFTTDGALCAQRLLRRFIDSELIATAITFTNLSPVAYRSNCPKPLSATQLQPDASVGETPNRLNVLTDWLHRIADEIETRFDDAIATGMDGTGRPF